MAFSFRLAASIQRKRMKTRSRRKRRRQKKMLDSKTWVARQIPLDLLIEIMTRLPPKSVMKFKCLSKFWSSLFSSRYFCNRFLMVSSSHQPSLYMCLMDLYDSSKSLLLSCDQDLTIREFGGFLWRALRGFVCFTDSLRAHIYNPTTRQLVNLPATNSNLLAQEPYFKMLYFICHEPVDDQYKILCTITVAADEDLINLKSELWIFVIEAGGSWKRVAKEFPYHFPIDIELNMNGFLYYLAWTDLRTCVLVSFDVKSEVFNIMEVPNGDRLCRYEKGMIPIEYGGKVALVDYTYLKKSCTVDIWVLEDIKNKEWTRKTLVLHPSQRHLVTHYYFEPRGTTQQGEVFFISKRMFSPWYYLCYDLRNNDLKKIEINGIPDRWFRKCNTAIYFDMFFMNPSESIMYLQT